MGCTSEAFLYESGGWIVRERRIFVGDNLASESVIGAKLRYDFAE